MKNYLFAICILLFFSCSSSADKGLGPDSAYETDGGTSEDTSVAPFPDGYAPPNADIDTSARVKDSIRRADSSR